VSRSASFAAAGCLLLLGCSADPDAADTDRGAEGVSQGDGKTVVHIGDSISVGEFGQQVQKDYASDARLAQLNFYAACGSKPADWLDGPNRTKHQQTSCGYLERHPDGSRVDDPWRASGTPPHEIPYLQDILAATKPSLVVVQLGLNMMGDPRPDGSIDSHRIAADVAQLKAVITGGGRRCVWIAPNVAPHWDPKAQDAFFATLTGALGNDCLVIDGRPLTRREDVGPDGVHVYGAGARRFADGAIAQIRDYIAR
jgi:hypothetical protein